MRIVFEELDKTVIPHFRGGEKETQLTKFEDEKNKIMFGNLEPGASIGMHIHETNSEIIYIVSGSGKVLYDNEEEILLPGMCHYCPKGHRHSLINTSAQETLVFFAVVPEQ